MKKIIKVAGIMLLCISLSACVSLITPTVQANVSKLKPGEYSLDKTHATLLFKVKHLGLSTYVGRFNRFDASLQFTPDNISKSKLSALIDIGSLDINDNDLKNDLMGRAWFHQSKYPTASFESSSVSSVNGNDFVFVGDLNWRGQIHPISVTATFNGGANNILTGKYTLGFSAAASFSRTQFGMDKFVPLVGDDVSIEAYAEFLKN